MKSVSFNKTLGKISAIFVVLIIFIGTIIYQATKREMIETLSILLNTTLEINVKGIREWIKDKKLDSRVLASQPLIKKNILSLIEFSKKPNISAQTLLQSKELIWLRKNLGSSSKEYGFYEFIILNKDGLQVGALYDKAVGVKDLSKSASFLQRTLAGETVVTLPFLSEIQLRDIKGNLRDSLPNIIVSTPIRDLTNEVVGALAFRLHPTGFSNLMSLSQFGDSGETYAFNKNAIMVSESRFTNQLKEIGLIPNSEESQSILKVSLRDPGKKLSIGKLIDPNSKSKWPLTLMANQATKGNSGINVKGYRDYRGIEVVGSWKWLSEYNLGIAHEIDKKEAYKSLNARIQLIILCLGGLFLAGIALVWLYLRQLRSEAEISSHKLDLEKAQNERTRLYEMLNNLPVLFHLQASDYSVPFANKMFNERFGDPTNKPCYALMHKRKEPCEVCTPFQIFNTNRTEESIWEAFDGRTYLTVVTPFQDLDGTPLVLEMAVDITEQKKAEKALEISKLEAEKANKAKSEFLARMSHEFRTPLNSILGFSQALCSQGKNLTDLQKQNVEQITHAGQYILKLVEDVLDLGKSEQNNLPVKIEEVSLNELIEESFGELQESAIEKKLNIKNNLPKNEEIWVSADSNHLKKVLFNLFSNSIKYNQKNGDIEISVTFDAPKTICLRISDTGAGIPKERQSQIFEPFNAIKPYKSFEEGIGMGLSISKLLMELMKGKIYFESEVDQGSSFFIELPLVKREMISPESLEDKFPGIKRFNKNVKEETNKEVNLSEISIQENIRVAFMEAAEMYNFTQMDKLTNELITFGSNEKLVAGLIKKHLHRYEIEEIKDILKKTKQVS